MSLSCLSLHHIRTSYSIFARVRFSRPSEFYEASREVGDRVLFQTGTRVEVYTTGDVNAVLEVLSEHSGIAEEELSGLFVLHTSDNAAEHLLRLACCIESRVLGETYIPWQVESALEQARVEGAAGALEGLFAGAVRASRRVRKETGIAGGELHKTAFEALRCAAELKGRRIVLYGAGLTGRRVAALAMREGASILVLNRNRDIAQQCAAEIGAEVVEYEDRFDALSDADVLICATLASHYRVTPELLSRHERRKRLVVLDVSPFRNVSPEVREMSHVTLVDSELSRKVEEHLAAMRAEVPKVKEIVKEELSKLRGELPELFGV